MTRPHRPYGNTVTWPLMGIRPPQGAVSTRWWELVEQHPDLDGARISEATKHPSTGCTVHLDIELERTMGVSNWRVNTVLAVAAAHGADVRHDDVDPSNVTVVAWWIETLANGRLLGVTVRTQVCSCHPEVITPGGAT